MEEVQVQHQILDPETEFLASKRETGNEWELFKENVRPLKRGRNISTLNGALKAQTQNQLKKSLLEERRKLIEAIDQYEGNDPLQPWIECIKWVQEAFPSAGDYSGLVLIYEQCVRAFWHSDRYKDDFRYLKVWLEYAENCVDAEVIFNFLDSNDIGKTHAAYYIAYALHLESKSKMKAANEILSTGIARGCEPIEKLRDAYKKFLVRSMRKQEANNNEDSTESNNSPVRNFGTVLAGEDNRRQTTRNSQAKKMLKPDQVRRAPLSVYNENSVDVIVQQPKLKTDLNPWQTLGTRAERNKENNAIPAKWKSFKVPQKPGLRAEGATQGPCIQVFVDEECSEKSETSAEPEGDRTSSLQLRQMDGKNIKKESELLRENPLRNFPLKCLPR